jgi:8-oxo-dGTP pyrophosphatase MutT (NUDIX family)
MMYRSLPDALLLYQFQLEGHDKPVGQLLKEIARSFTWSTEFWMVNHEARTVTLLGTTQHERDARMRATLLAERERDTFQVLTQWTGEENAVYGPGGTVLLSMERAAAPLFGIVTYGVQLLAYVDEADGPRVWLQRRARHKRTFAGLLDSTVGGRLPTGETPFACLVREAEEEASIPPDATRAGVVAVGAVSMVDVTDDRSTGESGLLCPDMRFVYELEVTREFTPRPNDGEAEEFVLLSVEQMRAAMGASRCTPGGAVVLLDFFVRRGIVTFENEPDYVEIVSRLRRRHDFGVLWE